jgi:hypothetical protein
MNVTDDLLIVVQIFPHHGQEEQGERDQIDKDVEGDPGGQEETMILIELLCAFPEKRKMLPNSSQDILFWHSLFHGLLFPLRNFADSLQVTRHFMPSPPTRD